MPLSYSRFRPAYILLILLALSACTNRPTAEAITKFSVALEGTSTSVQQGLGEIQRLEIAVNDGIQAEEFIENEEAKILLEQNDSKINSVIAPRVKFFKALSEYASSLAVAASDDQIEKVRTQFAETGNAFEELGKSVADNTGAQFPADLADSAVTAFSNLAAFMVDAKLNREIPIIVTRTHDDLTKGIEAFKSDLGDPDSGGFRSILRQHIKLLVEQKENLLFLIKDDDKSSTAELNDAVLAAKAQVRELQQSERLLAALPKTLDDLLSAHEALKKPKEKTTLGKIKVFFDRAKELQKIIKELKP